MVDPVDGVHTPSTIAQPQLVTSRFRPETPPTRASPRPIPPLIPRTQPRSDNPFSSAPYDSGHLNLDTFSPVNQNGSFEFDRVIKSGRVLRRVKKKGAWKPSWKPCYLVLRPNLLSVYKNPDETGFEASITLSEVTAVARVKKTHTEHVFGLFSPSKNYEFQGASDHDSSDWVTAVRMESRVDEQDDLVLGSPHLPPDQTDGPRYETTDASADEDGRLSGSPETSQAGESRAKPRSRASTQKRRTSNMHEYSGNEMTTSFSDFSDAASSLPRSMAALTTKPSYLTPIPSGQDLRPPMQRNTSQMSGFDISSDPERVVRQGWLQCLRSKGGVKQWRKLWLVLRPRNLSFYKNEQEYSALKIISISSIINAADIDPVSKSKTFCFQIILEDKTYKLCTDNEEMLSNWLGALKSVIAKRQEGQRQTL